MFCEIDDRMPKMSKHPQAKLYPSELVTIGVLFALKGGYFRAFYRWLKRDYEALFAGLPDRTRLQRVLSTHRSWCDGFLAQPSFFTVIDSYGIELIHPIREGRSEQQIGKKGKSNWRWIVGMKLCWLINDNGQVVSWDWGTANVHDQVVDGCHTFPGAVQPHRLQSLEFTHVPRLRFRLPKRHDFVFREVNLSLCHAIILHQ
jgi:hypothetical protein